MDPVDLDGSHARFRAAVVPAITEMQRANARLAAGYLAGFITVETGKRTAPTGTSAATVVGVSQAGKPLADALVSSLIATKVAIKNGHDLEAAMTIGRDIAIRSTGEDVINAARATIASGIRQDSRIVGWRRVTGGGCGACLASASGAIFPDDADMEIHPSCQCSAEPVVRDVPDDVQRPTGEAMFRALAVEQQDQLLGPDKAQIVRDGSVPFHALVDRSPMTAIPDQITETPLAALHPH